MLHTSGGDDLSFHDFACRCVGASQIGDEEDGVTSALWDLQRHQGDTPSNPCHASLLLTTYHLLGDADSALRVAPI